MIIDVACMTGSCGNNGVTLSVNVGDAPWFVVCGVCGALLADSTQIPAP